MVSVASASRYKASSPASLYPPRYQSRSSMCIRGLIPRNFAELAEAAPIGLCQDPQGNFPDPHMEYISCKFKWLLHIVFVMQDELKSARLIFAFLEIPNGLCVKLQLIASI